MTIKLAEFATQLGEITGQEKQAAARIAEFETQLTTVKQRIALPPQPVSALVYTLPRIARQSVDAVNQHTKASY